MAVVGEVGEGFVCEFEGDALSCEAFCKMGYLDFGDFFDFWGFEGLEGYDIVDSVYEFWFEMFEEFFVDLEFKG